MKEFQKIRSKEERRLKNLAESTGSSNGSNSGGSSVNQSELLDREFQQLEKDRESLETQREQIEKDKKTWKKKKQKQEKVRFYLLIEVKMKCGPNFRTLLPKWNDFLDSKTPLCNIP